jgi:hypothetical protein
MQLMRPGIVVLCLVTALSVVAARAPAAEVASRTVDRTFVCTPMAFGGIGDLDVNVSPLRDDNIGRRFVPVLETRTGGQAADESLVVARALKQPEHPGLAYNSSVGGNAGVFAHSRRCTPARKPVPLSPRGLPGPPVAWEKQLDCPVRGRVLVHVRADLRSPDDWRRVDPSYAGVRQPLVAARLAVRLEKTGKPIAFMELDSKGGTKLWYSAACS